MKRRVYEILIAPNDGGPAYYFQFFADNTSEACAHARMLHRNQDDHSFTVVSVQARFVGWAEEGSL